MSITKQTKANDLSTKEEISTFNELLISEVKKKIQQIRKEHALPELKDLIVNIHLDSSKKSYALFAKSSIFESQLGGYDIASEHTIETILNQFQAYAIEQYVTQNFKYLQKDDSLNFAGIEPLGFYAGDSEKTYNIHKYFINKNFEFINISKNSYEPIESFELILGNRKLVQKGNIIWFEYGVSKTFSMYFKTVQDAITYIQELHNNQLLK